MWLRITRIHKTAVLRFTLRYLVYVQVVLDWQLALQDSLVVQLIRSTGSQNAARQGEGSSRLHPGPSESNALYNSMPVKHTVAARPSPEHKNVAQPSHCACLVHGHSREK